MINNLHDFKNQANNYLWDAWAISSKADEKDIEELIKIIDLINRDVIWKLDGVCSFESEIDLNKIINILSDGGKIKKLSEVDFDE